MVSTILQQATRIQQQAARIQQLEATAAASNEREAARQEQMTTLLNRKSPLEAGESRCSACKPPTGGNL